MGCSTEHTKVDMPSQTSLDDFHRLLHNHNYAQKDEIVSQDVPLSLYCLIRRSDEAEYSPVYILQDFLAFLILSERVVLITWQAAVSQAFQSFVLRAHATKYFRMDRDRQPHSRLDSREIFRPKIQQLRELWAAKCQILMLMATLLPIEEASISS